jgi:competence protein ComEC
MTKGNFLLFFCGGALSAFVLVSFLSTRALLFLVLIIFILLLVSQIIFKKIKVYRAGFIIFIFAFILALTRYLGNLPVKEKINNFNSHFSGLVFVCENSERNGTFRNLILCDNAGRYISKTSAYPEYRYGDCLLAEGILELPGVIEDFRYDRYLAKQKIYFMLRQARFQKSENCNNLQNFGTPKMRLMSKLFWFRDYLMNRINQSIPEPDAGLATALLLGYNKTIGPIQQEWFSKSGLSHLIAISGSHITLIAALLSRLASNLNLKRKSALIFSSSLAIFYVIFSGAAPSAIRAGVMAFLTFLALFFGRENNAWRALLFAGTIMLFINPALLRDDIGFQLSFAAFTGLLLSAPLFQKHLSWWKEAFLVTLICQLFTWPISSYYFGVISLIAPLANLLSAWIFAPLFIILPVAIVFSFLGNFIGLLFFWPAYLLTRYLLTVARICASLPFAAVDYKIGAWVVFVYYFLLICLFLFTNQRKKKREK